MRNLFVIVIVFFTSSASAVQYIFHAPTYTLDEVPGADHTYREFVKISRTNGGLQEENIETQQAEITITTTCPSEETATATAEDFSVDSLNVIFAPGELDKAVPITIKTDDLYEPNEFFCLTIEENGGSEYYTKIIIPENDFCYEVTADGVANDYSINGGAQQYIGPWITSISNVIDIEITPVTGTDINIFLSNAANLVSANLQFYRISFDDTTNGGDTVLFRDTTMLTTLVSAGDRLMDGQTYRFWLQYDQSSGTISIGDDPVDRSAVLATFSDGSANALAVKHIYVSSSTASSASFRVCLSASPKQLDVVGVESVGYQLGGSEEKAVDGNRNMMFASDTCFFTNTVDDPWLQIDLGQVYDVRCVLIWPVADDADLGIAAADMVNAQVLVGSCPVDDVVAGGGGNALCYDITDDTANPIEGDCPASSYGQYVYVYKPGAGSQFALCEVEVYGTAVPYGSETTVQFTQEEYVIHENNGTVELQTYRNFPSESATCTQAEYYTDNAVSPSSANSNDFVPISNNPSTASDRQLSWNQTDASGDSVLQSFPITINNDNPGVCESYETFNVYLTNVVGGIIGDQSWARVKIIDDDSVSYSLAQSTFTFGEGDVYASIPVMRSGVGTMQTGSAELVFTDTSATSADYNNSAITVNFGVSVNEDTENGLVPIKEDEIYEETESFTISLGTLTPNDDDCSRKGEIDTATGMLTDNDSRFRFDATIGATIVIPEGEFRNIGIKREGTAQEKNLEIVVTDKTADLGDDFTLSPSTKDGISTVTFVQDNADASVIIDTENDSELEESETFTLTLRDPLHPDGNRADPFYIDVTILDNDALVFWKQLSYSVPESSGLINVCLQRTGATDAAKTVYITTTSISATPGNDYSPLTSIHFTSGASEACGQIPITSDSVLENNEDFLLTINEAQQDIVVDNRNTASVTITDDDILVGWAQATYSFNEASGSNEVFIFKSGSGSVSVTVSLASGSATLGSDFELSIGSGSTISIPPGTQSYPIPVMIINDNEDEDNEGFVLSLSGPSSGVISQAQTRVTITDDDLSTPAPPTSGTDLGIGAIAGIIVGAVVGLIFIVTTVFICCLLATPSAGSAPPIAPGVPLGTYPSGYNEANYDIAYDDINGYKLTGLPNAGYAGNNYQPYQYGSYNTDWI